MSKEKNYPVVFKPGREKSLITPSVFIKKRRAGFLNKKHVKRPKLNPVLLKSNRMTEGPNSSEYIDNNLEEMSDEEEQVAEIINNVHPDNRNDEDTLENLDTDISKSEEIFFCNNPLLDDTCGNWVGCDNTVDCKNYLKY